MSRLVQLWENSYEFTENELVLFAESQKQLSKTVKAPMEITELNNSPKKKDWTIKFAKELINKHTLIDSDLPSNIGDLHGKVKQRIKVTTSLLEITQTLQCKLSDLQQHHDQVGSRSLIMQSLWEGLVNKQEECNQTVDKIEKELAPYLQYEGLYRSLIDKDPPLAKNFTENFAKVISHLEHLTIGINQQSKHLDAPLYQNRYQTLLRNSSKRLLTAILAELEIVTRQFSNRLAEDKHASNRSRDRGRQSVVSDQNINNNHNDPSTPQSFTSNAISNNPSSFNYMSFLANVNAEFLVCATTVTDSLAILESGSNQLPDLKESVTNIVNRYFSIRTSLLYHFYNSFFESIEEYLPLEQLTRIVELVHHILREERLIANHLFGNLFPHFHSQFKQFIEGFLIPILGQVRDLSLLSNNNNENNENDNNGNGNENGDIIREKRQQEQQKLSNFMKELVKRLRSTSLSSSSSPSSSSSSSMGSCTEEQHRLLNLLNDFYSQTVI